MPDPCHCITDLGASRCTRPFSHADPAVISHDDLAAAYTEEVGVTGTRGLPTDLVIVDDPIREHERVRADAIHRLCVALDIPETWLEATPAEIQARADYAEIRDRILARFGESVEIINQAFSDLGRALVAGFRQITDDLADMTADEMWSTLYRSADVMTASGGLCAPVEPYFDEGDWAIADLDDGGVTDPAVLEQRYHYTADTPPPEHVWDESGDGMLLKDLLDPGALEYLRKKAERERRGKR
jgi:hypothetical protein